jgi:hypothetical protein
MPVGNRLSDMAYDEVSLVDAGACNDDTEGAHVLLMKRATKISDDEVADFTVRKSRPSDGGSTKSSSKPSSKKKKGNTQRAANWNESRHPRTPSGPGGGEFSASSAQSKTKYGKGGTAIDNLPKGYKTTNSAAEKLGLEHGITAAQRKLSDVASAKKGGGGGKGKKKGKGSRTKLTPQQRQERKQVSLINGLAANQRSALRDSGKKIPAGYQWNSNDRLVNSANVAARNKLASSLGLPAAETKKKRGKKAKAERKTVTGLVMDRSGHIHRVTTVVKPPKKTKAAKKPKHKKPPTKKTAKQIAAKKKRLQAEKKLAHTLNLPGSARGKKSSKAPKKAVSPIMTRKGTVKKNSALDNWLYGERSAAS